jgi:hypothetical protein
MCPELLEKFNKRMQALENGQIGGDIRAIIGAAKMNSEVCVLSFILLSFAMT